MIGKCENKRRVNLKKSHVHQMSFPHFLRNRKVHITCASIILLAQHSDNPRNKSDIPCMLNRAARRGSFTHRATSHIESEA